MKNRDLPYNGIDITVPKNHVQGAILFNKDLVPAIEGKFVDSNTKIAGGFKGTGIWNRQVTLVTNPPNTNTVYGILSGSSTSHTINASTNKNLFKEVMFIGIQSGTKFHFHVTSETVDNNGLEQVTNYPKRNGATSGTALMLNVNGIKVYLYTEDGTIPLTDKQDVWMEVTHTSILTSPTSDSYGYVTIEVNVSDTEIHTVAKPYMKIGVINNVNKFGPMFSTMLGSLDTHKMYNPNYMYRKFFTTSSILDSSNTKYYTNGNAVEFKDSEGGSVDYGSCLSLVPNQSKLDVFCKAIQPIILKGPQFYSGMVMDNLRCTPLEVEVFENANMHAPYFIHTHWEERYIGTDTVPKNSCKSFVGKNFFVNAKVSALQLTNNINNNFSKKFIDDASSTGRTLEQHGDVVTQASASHQLIGELVGHTLILHSVAGCSLSSASNSHHVVMRTPAPKNSIVKYAIVTNGDVSKLYTSFSIDISFRKTFTLAYEGNKPIKGHADITTFIPNIPISQNTTTYVGTTRYDADKDEQIVTIIVNRKKPDSIKNWNFNVLFGGQIEKLGEITAKYIELKFHDETLSYKMEYSILARFGELSMFLVESNPNNNDELNVAPFNGFDNTIEDFNTNSCQLNQGYTNHPHYARINRTMFTHNGSVVPAKVNYMSDKQSTPCKTFTFSHQGKARIATLLFNGYHYKLNITGDKRTDGSTDNHGLKTNVNFSSFNDWFLRKDTFPHLIRFGDDIYPGTTTNGFWGSNITCNLTKDDIEIGAIYKCVTTDQNNTASTATIELTKEEVVVDSEPNVNIDIDAKHNNIIMYSNLDICTSYFDDSKIQLSMTRGEKHRALLFTI